MTDEKPADTLEQPWPADSNLRYIEQFEHRGYTVKIARRGEEFRLLIYPPNTLIATHMVTGQVQQFRNVVDDSRRKVDDLIIAETLAAASGYRSPRVQVSDRAVDTNAAPEGRDDEISEEA